MSDAIEVDSNGALGVNENGGGASTSGGGGGANNQGWQMVTNVKKQKRQEKVAKLAAASQPDGAADSGKKGSDSKAFQALESEAEERRARRRAKPEVSAASTAAAGGEHYPSGEDDSDGDGEDGTKGIAGLNGDPVAKKSKSKKSKKPKVSVPEAAAAIDPTDLATFLAGISESFEILPDVQLMRCADYFARAFNPVTNEKFAWNKILRESPIARSIEIPYSYLPEPLIEATSDWLSQRPVDALSTFTVWLLSELTNDIQKKAPASPSKPKVGVIVVLALLLRKKPEVLVQQAETIRTHFPGPDKFHILAWAYGQAAQGDLVAGMALWVQNLLPLAVGKTSTPGSRDISLQFIEHILLANPRKGRTILLNGASRKGERLVPPAAFDSMLRATFPSESSKTKATERLQGVYYLIKELALAGPMRSKATKPVALQVLPLSLAAVSEDTPGLQQEAISCALWALAQNPDCYQQWEKLHMENLKASIRVLNYINKNWKESAPRLEPLDDLKRTLQALSSKHRRALKAKDGNTKMQSNLKEADTVTKALLKKTSRIPVFTTAFVTIAVGAAVAYGFYLLSPEINPWGWDGKVLLSNTHNYFGLGL